MLKLIKNQVNRIELVVSSTIDISGFSAKLTIDSTESIIPDISVNSPTFEVQQAAVDSLGECNALLPLEIIDTKGSVYSTVKVAARAVDTPVGVLRNDQRIFTVLVGDIASPNEHNVALEAEIEARKLADTLVLRDANDYTDKKFGEAKIFVYAGQVDTVADLPEDAETGAVYNVLSTGANYVWNGEAWDKLSENIDLSIFPTKTELANEEKARKDADAELKTSIDGLTTKVDGLDGSIATINGELAKKATTEALDAVDAAVKTKASAESVTELTNEVASKVAKSDFDTLKADVDKKALKSELDALATTVGGKADQTSLDTLKTTVENKADKSTVESIETELGQKASQEGLSALSGTVKTLSDDVEKKAEATALTALEGVVSGKADASALTALEGTVATKADQSSLEALEEEVGKKALQSDLTALSGKVDAKADASAVTALETKVDGKASQTELDSLKTAVDGKAASKDLTDLNTKVSGILDGTTLISSLVFTLDGDDTKKYRIKVELIDDGSGTSEPTLSVVPA